MNALQASMNQKNAGLLSLLLIGAPAIGGFHGCTGWHRACRAAQAFNRGTPTGLLLIL
jgi:hypothetical protein